MGGHWTLGLRPGPGWPLGGGCDQTDSESPAAHCTGGIPVLPHGFSPKGLSPLHAASPRVDARVPSTPGRGLFPLQTRTQHCQGSGLRVRIPSVQESPAFCCSLLLPFQLCPWPAPTGPEHPARSLAASQ